MYIELRDIKTFSETCGLNFELPSNIIRLIEFEDVVVFLLDNGGKRDLIVGVKFSQEGGKNHFYIAWEFRSIDGKGIIHQINGMTKTQYKGEESVRCYSATFSVEYYLNPDTGEQLERNEIR